MTLTIQGLAIPIGIKNKNGWGLPPSEADNAIESLKSSVLKICPGEAHACDYSEDPFGRIGRVTDAWLEADGVHARGEVTDSVAERKIKEGTWDEQNWSTYGKGTLDDDKWAHGFKAETMTLVRNPAWDSAHYNVSASAEGDYGLRTVSQFQLIASTSSPKDEQKQSQEGDSIPNELETKIKDLEAAKADLESKLSAAENKAVSEITDAKTQIETLTASNEELQKILSEKETALSEKEQLIASLEKDRTGMVTLKEAEELAQKISAANAEKAIADYIENQEKKTLVASIVEIRNDLGIKADNEKLNTLSASELKERFEEYNSLKLAASGPGTERMKLYASAGDRTDSRATVGNYNNGTSWTV